MTSMLARPMLSGLFVASGFDALRNPESKAPMAEPVAPAMTEPFGINADAATLVKVNGAVQVVAGSLLALGKLPRLSALALAGSLLPTTYAGHRFWEESDQAKRAQQRTQFLKNTAVFGGLVLAAADTGGRPSLTWKARRAAGEATKAARSGRR